MSAKINMETEAKQADRLIFNRFLPSIGNTGGSQIIYRTFQLDKKEHLDYFFSDLFEYRPIPMI